MRVLFDTNVVLDVLLDREPHAHTAVQLLALVDDGRMEGCVAASSVTTIYYLAARQLGDKRTRDLVSQLLDLFQVAAIDRPVLLGALSTGFADYEDGVLHESARAAGATAIVTRDRDGFAGSSLPVFHPAELLAAVAAL